MTTTAHKHWFTALSDALDKTKREGNLSGVFQLATCDKLSSVPRVRTHILRAFLAPSTHPTIPLLITTTDIRSTKIGQITAEGSSRIEAVFWTESTMEQFRVMGPVYIVPSPPYATVLPQPGQSPVFDVLRETDGVDWEQTRCDTFNALSSGMRASWCRPAPGSPLKGGYGEGLKWPQTVPKLGGLCRVGDGPRKKNNICEGAWATGV
ncbi:hypothetical protein SCLCIDRAFT_1207173 [Scleroderma citrinum Foug A]|uniref:Pyridoxamine 5'-phosphate oxidase Alr4036 family FMN-binding domain-containing protein n=1 Tax=Scleroderma citrinum Foug A TaxID=1036808 RepID=A0A0C3EPY7_9AGAM|nr:hypothetical protein SCLCIDRAFT_1207173 [Scleroderma citrinum Foug A]